MYSLKGNVGVKQKKLNLNLASEVFASLKLAIAECYVRTQDTVSSVLITIPQRTWGTAYCLVFDSAVVVRKVMV